jgi:hypothetical protein
VKVEFMSRSVSGNDHRSWVVRNLTAGTAPDIMYQNEGGRQYSDHAQGWLVKLDPIYELPNPYVPSGQPGSKRWGDLFYKVWQDALRAGDGGIYWVGIDTVGIALGVNVEWLKKVNWDPAKRPETHQQFMGLGRQLQAQMGPTEMAYHPGVHDWYYVGMDYMVWADKFEAIHNVVPQTASITPEEFVKAWWQGVFAVDSPRTRDQWRLTAESYEFLRPGNSVGLPPTLLDQFVQGKIGMIQLYGAQTRNVEFDTIRKFDYVVWPLPKLTPEDSKYAPADVVSPWATGNAGYSTIWNITSTATKKGSLEACVDWLMYIVRPGPVDDIVNELGALVPGIRGGTALPYLKGFTTEMDRLTTDPKFKDVHALATRYSTSVEYSREIMKMLQQMGLKEVTWEQAVDGLTKTYDKVANDLIKVNGWDTSKWGPRTPYPAGGKV